MQRGWGKKTFALKALFVDQLQTPPETASALAVPRQSRVWFFWIIISGWRGDFVKAHSSRRLGSGWHCFLPSWKKKKCFLFTTTAAAFVSWKVETLQLLYSTFRIKPLIFLYSICPFNNVGRHTGNSVAAKQRRKVKQRCKKCGWRDGGIRKRQRRKTPGGLWFSVVCRQRLKRDENDGVMEQRDRKHHCHFLLLTGVMYAFLLLSCHSDTHGQSELSFLSLEGGGALLPSRRPPFTSIE